MVVMTSVGRELLSQVDPSYQMDNHMKPATQFKREETEGSTLKRLDHTSNSARDWSRIEVSTGL